jgi:hypothetical protein
MRWAKDFNIALITRDSNEDILFVGGSSDGLVVDLNSGKTDDGTTINPFYVTRWMDFGRLGQMKGMEGIYVGALLDESQVVKITQFLDFADAGSEYNLNLTGGGDTLT